MDLDFQIGERWVFLEENALGKTKWNKYFSVIDFDSNVLTLYGDENKGKAKKRINIQNCEFYDAVKMKNRPCTIKIQPQPVGSKKKPKPYYLATETLRAIDEMKVELEECSGSFEGLDKKESKKVFNCLTNGLLFAGSQGAVLRLEHVDVADWTKKDVIEWLHQIKKAKTCEKQFKENDIDGCILVELDEQTLLNIKIPPSETENLVMEINRLKKTRKFSRSRFTVKSKFERFPGFTSEADEFQDMIDSLCDSSKLKHRFLNTADLQAHTLVKKKGGRGSGRKGGFASIHHLTDEPLEQFREAKIKVKIVVTEILHSNKSKSVRKFLSPIVSAAVPKLQNEFGFFHTAIIVGPWYLEWTDSELVIPKRMVSGRAIISADVDTLNVPKEGLKEISDKIAEVVVKWNTRYKYRNTSVKGGTSAKKRDANEGAAEGNCQDFVDDIMEALGISCDFGGALGGFIKKMRGSGKCVLEFSPCKEFRDYFGVKEKSWTFKTHEELDAFCVKVREQCLDVYNIFSSEWSLLKSFDRAFWLRHLKMPDDPRYIPLPPKERTLKTFNTGCPFDDPRNTKSYT